MYFSKTYEDQHLNSMSPGGNTKTKGAKVNDFISSIFGHFCPKLKIVVNWSCDHSKRSQEKQKSDGDGFGCHFSDIQAIFGHLGPLLAIFGQFWPQTQNCCKLVM